MHRCTGATPLREATSELAPLTTAQLSAPSSIRGCPMSTRPGPKRGLASSLRVHDRSTRAQGPCDARAVRATTRTAPSCVRAGLSYRACSRWRPRPFPALDGGRAPVTRVDRVRSPGTPSSSSSSWTGARSVTVAGRASPFPEKHVRSIAQRTVARRSAGNTSPEHSRNYRLNV